MALDVYIEGAYAGVLSEIRGHVRFEYSDEYRSSSGTPLSLSMSPIEARHDGEYVRSWIDNLLPDSEETRTSIAQKFDSRAIDAYSLLHHIGVDVAGAVQFVPEGDELDTRGELMEWTTARIAAEIDRLRANPAAVDEDAEVGHWSLAGQHGKFALARAQGGWAEPNGVLASTHIFKVGMNHLSGSDLAEFVTMRVARAMGLSVAGVELEQFHGRTAVVVQRYDRVTRDGRAVRVHQEDLCQALGVRGADKYESDGGPSLAQASALLARRVSSDDLERSILEFARLQAFNIAVANTDAHGKNTSLLLRGSRVRLAPAYDLISGALVWDPTRVWFKGKMAMKIGGDYRLQRMTSARLERTASALGVGAEGFMSTVGEYARQWGEVVSRVLTEAGEAGAERNAVSTMRGQAQEWADLVSRELGGYDPGVPLVVAPGGAFSEAFSSAFDTGRRASPSDRTCDAYIARTRSRCVLPVGHPGWPARGHRSAK